MLARISSMIVLWAIATLSIIYGKSYGFAIIIGMLALAANIEVCALLRKMGFKPSLWYIQITTLVIFICSTNVLAGKQIFISEWIGLFAIAILGLSIVIDPYGDYVKKTVLPTAATIFIVPFMLKNYALIASLGEGFKYIMVAVWVIAAAKFSDVGAYVIGCAFGHHKMAPTMSPNKTWEGAVGGIISSAIIGAVISGFCLKYELFPARLTPLTTALISMPIGMVAIISDLLESVLKRRAGVKDSGAIIPGIGGALDLADSLLLVAPIISLIFLFTYAR